MKFVSFIFILIIIKSCSTNDTIKIATSANMHGVVAEMIGEFNKQNNVKIDIVSGASGLLSSQIELGAPYDIFVSANVKYPEHLSKTIIGAGKPEVYALGQLVLVSNTIQPSINILKTDKVKTIGIPNPKTAPYGLHCIEVLKNYQIYENVKHKLVYGESVGQVNSFIYSGAVDIGITAISSVKGIGKSPFNWVGINKKKYSTISQSAILLNPKNKDVKQFYDFLFSDKGQEILRHSGFSPKP